MVDDGTHGIDSNLSNNSASDKDTYYVPPDDPDIPADPKIDPKIDSHGDLFKYKSEWMPHLTLLPLMSPMYSGQAQPGASFEMVIRDSSGNEIGRRMVQADVGGNWFLSFPVTALHESHLSNMQFLSGDGIQIGNGSLFRSERINASMWNTTHINNKGIYDRPYSISLNQYNLYNNGISIYYSPALISGMYSANHSLFTKGVYEDLDQRYNANMDPNFLGASMNDAFNTSSLAFGY